MTAKTKTKEQPALFEEGAPPPENIKKSLDEPPKSARSPAPPKSHAKNQVAKFEPPKSVLRIIAEAAANPAIDVAKMQALIEIQRDTEAKEQFHSAMLAVDADLPRITKDGKIEMKSGKALRFASFENINKIVKPILRSHGLRLTFQPDVNPSGVGIIVHCHLTKGLYRESCTVPVPTTSASPAMNAQQGVGNAISYAKRYGTIALLNIETEAPEDRDLDGNDPAKAKEIEQRDAAISAADLKKVKAAIDDCKVPLTTVLIKYQIDGIEELRAINVKDVLAACAKYKAESEKRAQPQ